MRWYDEQQAGDEGHKHLKPAPWADLLKKLIYGQHSLRILFRW